MPLIGRRNAIYEESARAVLQSQATRQMLKLFPDMIILFLIPANAALPWFYKMIAPHSIAACARLQAVSRKLSPMSQCAEKTATGYSLPPK